MDINLTPDAKEALNGAFQEWETAMNAKSEQMAIMRDIVTATAESLKLDKKIVRKAFATKYKGDSDKVDTETAAVTMLCDSISG